MCGDKFVFSELNESFRNMVKLGNNTRMTMVGRGNVKINVSGVTQVITEVFYGPKLQNNLLSIGQLQEKGLVL